MSWNYRVMRRVFGGEESFSIHEVYYNEDGSLRNWTTEPQAVSVETLDDLRRLLEWMAEALDKPVLDWHDSKAASESISISEASDPTTHLPCPTGDLILHQRSYFRNSA